MTCDLNELILHTYMCLVSMHYVEHIYHMVTIAFYIYIVMLPCCLEIIVPD